MQFTNGIPIDCLLFHYYHWYQWYQSTSSFRGSQVLIYAVNKWNTDRQPSFPLVKLVLMVPIDKWFTRGPQVLIYAAYKEYTNRLTTFPMESIRTNGTNRQIAYARLSSSSEMQFTNGKPME